LLITVKANPHATIATGVMAVYAGMEGLSAGHILTASVLGAPAGLLVGKIMFPETHPSETGERCHFETKKTATNSLDALCTGGFLAIASRSSLREPLTRTARSASLFLATSILLVFVWSLKTRVLPAFFHPIRDALIALFFGALLIVCVNAEPWDRIGRFFNRPGMRFFGKYSYGIYIFRRLCCLRPKHARGEREAVFRMMIVSFSMESILSRETIYDLCTRQMIRSGISCSNSRKVCRVITCLFSAKILR